MLSTFHLWHNLPAGGLIWTVDIVISDSNSQQGDNIGMIKSRPPEHLMCSILSLPDTITNDKGVLPLSCTLTFLIAKHFPESLNKNTEPFPPLPISHLSPSSCCSGNTLPSLKHGLSAYACTTQLIYDNSLTTLHLQHISLSLLSVDKMSRGDLEKMV